MTDPALERALANWSVGTGFTGSASRFVVQTPELLRILALPRYAWEEDKGLEELIDLMTAAYRTPNGRQRFLPAQAALLEALFDLGGAFGILGVGEGKTLPSFVAGTVVQAKRTAILVPAKLKQKTIRDFTDLAEHWIAPPHYEIFTYSKIGRDGGENLLENYAPDLVVGDEVHALKNLDGAAVARKVCRYLKDRKAKFLAMSGSVITRSLLDFHHILALSIGLERMPLPIPRSEVKVWAQCVDEKVVNRALPGALIRFLKPGEPPSLENVRNVVGRRIQETNGIIRTRGASIDCPIILDFFDPEIPEEMSGIVSRLVDGYERDGEKVWEAPNGDDATPVDVYRHLRTLVAGFYYEWVPPPPKPWLDARRAWKAFAREALMLQQPGIDSELQVANAVDRGELSPSGVRTLERWREIRPTYKENTIPRWLHTRTLELIARKIRSNTIVWVEHTAVGEKLSELTGLDYYHRKGLDSKGKYIDDAKGAIIASIRANSEGRNLQKWNHNLVVTPMPNGKEWEQLMGRTHRRGQLASEVTFDVCLGHPKIHEQMRQAFSDARFIFSKTGQQQKLLLADRVREA